MLSESKFLNKKSRNESKRFVAVFFISEIL